MKPRMNLSILQMMVMGFLGISIFFWPLPGICGEEKPIKLTLVSGWTSPFKGNVKLEKFVKLVNERGKGKVFIDYKGGHEIAPQTKSPGLVRDGVYDMVHTTPGYYAGLCPQAIMGYYAPSDPSLLRRIGFNDVMDEVHRKKMNCAYLGMLWRGENFVVLSRKPIRSADFSGLKSHSVTHSVLAFKYLGAVTVSMSTAEFYVGLQRGVVDAIPLPMGMLPLEMRLYEVADYIMHPPIPITTTATLLANAERWDSLPPEVRKLIMDTIIELEPEVYDYYRKVMTSAEETLVQEKGMKIIDLPPEDLEKYYYAFTDYTWDQFKKKMPVYGPKVYELCKPYLKKH